MKITQLERILFDPVAWIHPQQAAIPLMFQRGRCRSVVNDALRRKFQLPLPAAVQQDEGLTRFFITHWQQLTQAAFLLCCQRYRATLMRQGLYGRLPAAVRQFMTLDLLPSYSDTAEKKFGWDELLQNMAYELSGYERLITTPLRHCLPLLFPPQTPTPREAMPVPAVELLTLKLAIQHAQHNASSFSV